jgi:hypothetical protein
MTKHSKSSSRDSESSKSSSRKSSHKKSCKNEGSISYKVASIMGYAGGANKLQQPSRMCVDESTGNVYGAYSASGTTLGPSSNSEIVKFAADGTSPLQLYNFDPTVLLNNYRPVAIHAKKGDSGYIYALVQNLKITGAAYTNAPAILRLKTDGSSNINSSVYANLPSDAAYVQDFVFNKKGDIYVSSGNSDINTTPVLTLTQGMILKVTNSGASVAVWSTNALYNANLVTTFRTRYDTQARTVRSLGTIILDKHQKNLYVVNIDNGLLLKVSVKKPTKPKVYLDNVKVQSCNAFAQDNAGNFWFASSNLDAVLKYDVNEQTFTEMVGGHPIIDSPLDIKFKSDKKCKQELFIMNSGFLRIAPAKTTMATTDGPTRPIAPFSPLSETAQQNPTPVAYKGGVQTQSLGLLTIN